MDENIILYCEISEYKKMFDIIENSGGILTSYSKSFDPKMYPKYDSLVIRHLSNGWQFDVSGIEYWSDVAKRDNKKFINIDKYIRKNKLKKINNVNVY